MKTSSADLYKEAADLEKERELAENAKRPQRVKLLEKARDAKIRDAEQAEKIERDMQNPNISDPLPKL